MCPRLDPNGCRQSEQKPLLARGLRRFHRLVSSRSGLAGSAVFIKRGISGWRKLAKIENGYGGARSPPCAGIAVI